MVHMWRIDEAIQEVVGEALEWTGQVDEEPPSGLGMFDALRGEFPHATLMTINLPALLAAVQAAGERHDA